MSLQYPQESRTEGGLREVNARIASNYDALPYDVPAKSTLAPGPVDKASAALASLEADMKIPWQAGLLQPLAKQE